MPELRRECACGCHGRRKSAKSAAKKPKPQAPAPFAVAQQIDAQRVADTLVSGLEGGTGYWAQIDSVKGPRYSAQTCDKIAAGCAFLLIIEHGGGEGSGKTYTLDRAALARGVEIMARDYPSHYADMVNENDDATTGDVLMQCALLGEVIYG